MPLGGVARRATLIRQERESSDHALVLDAGNSLVGDGEPAISTAGRTSVEALNRLGYDAVALGLLDITSLPLADLQARLAEARFPFLSANAVVTATGELLARPYVVVDLGGRRVGILGLTEPGTTAEVRVGDPLEAAAEWLPALQGEGAEIVVLLSHAGLEADRRIVEALGGIDVVIGGRDGGYQNPMLAEGALMLRADYASAGNAGRYVGVAHLSFGGDGALVEHGWSQVALRENYAEDPDVAAWRLELPAGG